MPLKHHTETFLVALLGFAVVLTGIAIATLPLLPGGILPWAIFAVLSVVYPLVLTPMFKRRRADYPFRLLHWAPALMLLLWLLVELLHLYVPTLPDVHSWYTWAWTLPAVTVCFVLLAAYCLNVIRRWVPRILVLLVLFVPFTVGAVLSQQGGKWDEELASVLWQGEWWNVFDSGSVLSLGRREIAMNQSGTGEDVNLDPSDDPKEEAWRENLRNLEQRRQERLQRRREREMGSDADESSSSSEPAEIALSGNGDEIRQASSLPSQLPTSGFGIEFLGGIVLAGYAGVLHQRAQRRK